MHTDKAGIYVDAHKLRRVLYQALFDKEVNPKWWEYVHYDPVKVCLSANDGYRHVELLSYKYNLRYKKYDK